MLLSAGLLLAGAAVNGVGIRDGRGQTAEAAIPAVAAPEA
jgi:hypothetical protein